MLRNSGLIRFCWSVQVIPPTFYRLGLLALAMHAGVLTDIEHLNELFVNLDQDHDGAIDLLEFSTAMSEVMGRPPQSFHPLFEAIDLSKTGRIPYSEFLVAVAWHNNVLKEDDIQTAFYRLDADGTGVISFDNLKAVMPDDVSDAHIKHIMSELEGPDSSMPPAPTDVRSVRPRCRSFSEGVDLPTFRRLMRHPSTFHVKEEGLEWRRQSSKKRLCGSDARNSVRPAVGASHNSPSSTSAPGVRSTLSHISTVVSLDVVEVDFSTGFDPLADGGGNLDRAQTRSISYQESIMGV